MAQTEPPAHFFVNLIVFLQTPLTAPTKLGVFFSKTLLTDHPKLGETPLNLDDPLYCLNIFICESFKIAVKWHFYNALLLIALE